MAPALVSKDGQVKSGYSSSNAYLNKSGRKYAQSVANPLNHSFVFVLCMFLGGLLGRMIGGRNRSDSAGSSLPVVHTHHFGKRPLIRYGLTFCGGVIVL